MLQLLFLSILLCTANAQITLPTLFPAKTTTTAAATTTTDPLAGLGSAVGQLVSEFLPCVIVNPCGTSQSAQWSNPFYFQNDGSCQTLTNGIYVKVAPTSCLHGNPVQFHLYPDDTCYTEYEDDASISKPGLTLTLNFTSECQYINKYSSYNYTCGYSFAACTPSKVGVQSQSSNFILNLPDYIIFFIITGFSVSVVGLLYLFVWRKPVVKSLLPTGVVTVHDESVMNTPFPASGEKPAPAPATDKSSTGAANNNSTDSPPDKTPKQRSGNLYHHICRMFFEDITSIRAFANEPLEYQANHDHHRYMLWRHSIFPVLAIYQFAVFILDILVLMFYIMPTLEYSYLKTSSFLKPGVAQVNQVMLIFEVLRIIVYILAFFLILYAWLNWRDLKKSQRILTYVWGLQFVFPFFLQLVPFRSLINFPAAITAGFNSIFGFVNANYSQDQVRFALTQFCKVGSMSVDVITYININQGICPDVFDDLVIALDVDYGLRFMGTALLQLVPISLSLLPGISAAGVTIKLLLPWHYLPPIISAFSDFIFTPLTLTFLCLFYQTVGNIIFLGFIIFILLKQVFHLPHIMKLSTEHTSTTLRGVIQRISAQRWVFETIAGIYLVAFLSLHQFYWQTIKNLNLPALLMLLNPWEVAFILVRAIAITLLSRLFISGYILSLLIHMHLNHSRPDFLVMIQTLFADLTEEKLQIILGSHMGFEGSAQLVPVSVVTGIAIGDGSDEPLNSKRVAPALPPAPVPTNPAPRKSLKAKATVAPAPQPPTPSSKSAASPMPLLRAHSSAAASPSPSVSPPASPATTRTMELTALRQSVFDANGNSVSQASAAESESKYSADSIQLVLPRTVGLDRV